MTVAERVLREQIAESSFELARAREMLRVLCQERHAGRAERKPARRPRRYADHCQYCGTRARLGQLACPDHVDLLALDPFYGDACPQVANVPVNGSTGRMKALRDEVAA